jgi:16S rRNA (guanine527-N7)-methyltransferase
VAQRDLRSRLARRAAKSNVFLAEELAEGLLAYYELLARWNRKINLTSLDDPDQAIDRLLLEPVVATRYFPSSAAIHQLDMGSGGGSPAIPMKLAAPQIHLRMVEVKARKSAFLREAVRHLGLKDTSVETARYEELLARPELHETSDVVSVRAVRLETRALTTLQAFLAVGGRLMLFRGPSGPEEPSVIIPPLQWVGTYPLMESHRSRLTVLSKAIR